MDVLDTTLNALRIRGVTLLHEQYVAPWAITVPSAVSLAEALGERRGAQAIAFHLVREGAFTLHLAGQSPLRLEAGEAAIVFGGQAHTMLDGRGATPRSVCELMGRQSGREPVKKRSGTRLICGAFFVEEPELHPLYGGLPAVLRARVTGQSESTANALIELLEAELSARALGAAFATSRVVELLCLRVLREQALEPSRPIGVLRALGDPVVRRALDKIARELGREISVALLARDVALSPSRFAARFRNTMGMSPMEFTARLRMDTAARLLRKPDLSVGEIAHRCGYESLPAFSRAFSRIVGHSPKAWRAQRSS